MEEKANIVTRFHEICRSVDPVYKLVGFSAKGRSIGARHKYTVKGNGNTYNVFYSPTSSKVTYITAGNE